MTALPKKENNNIYKISHLIRGLFGTEAYILNHNKEEDFIILNDNTNYVPIAEELSGHIINFKCGKSSCFVEVTDYADMDLLPYICEQKILNNELHLKIIKRSSKNKNWQQQNDPENNSYTYNVTTQTGLVTVNTAKNEIIIDLLGHDLSGGYKIAIMHA